MASVLQGESAAQKVGWAVRPPSSSSVSLSAYSQASHLEGYLSPKCMQMALTFRASEMSVGCPPSMAEVFRRKCKLERCDVRTE